MNNFYIIANETRDIGLKTTERINRYLSGKGAVCHGIYSAVSLEDGTEPLNEKIPEDVQCVIVLGGDGTLLRVARNLVGRKLPLLGINLGHLGYLTEGDRDTAFTVLDQVMEDNYILENRMMLLGRLIRDGRTVCENLALNDITINRNRSLKIIDFDLFVNENPLYSYRADGIIVSTPTGSTAYNLSCGGPVVEPTAELFLITPIAPHSLNNRSLILSSEDVIGIEIKGSVNDPDDQIEYVSYCDGDELARLQPGDRIEVVKASQVTPVLKLSHRSFLETLRVKMSQ